MTRLSLLLLLLALAVGCASADGLGALVQTDAGTPDPPCSSDADCAAGESCRFGICVDPEPRTLTLSLEIEPPDYRDDLVRQQVTGLPVTLGTSLPDYEMGRPIRVQGAVVYDDASGAPVSATVRFRGTSGIPGQAFSANTRTETGGTDFAIDLPPGVYDITVIDDRADAGRIVRRGVVVSPDAARARPCDESGRICQSESIVLPAPSGYIRVHGTLARSTPQLLPVAGARVYAVSRDGRFESTDDVTDETGAFDLLIAAGSDVVDVHMRPAGDEPLPSLTFPALQLAPDAPNDVALTFGPWPDLLPLPVAVTLPSGAGEGASVSIAARSERTMQVSIGERMETVDARFEARALTDPLEMSRAWVVPVPSGPLTISVLPGDRSFSPVAVSLEVPSLALPALEPVEIAPSALSRLEGTVVVDRTGAPVPGAVVSATYVGTPDVDAVAFGVPEGLLDVTAETDALGVFAMPVARGRWRITVDAPEAVGAARYEAATIELGEPTQLNVAMARGGAASGRIVDYDGRPVAGATVRAWRVEGASSVLLWQSTTDTDGVYRLVLADAPIDD